MNSMQTTLQSGVLMSLLLKQNIQPIIPRDEVDDIRDVVFCYFNIPVDDSQNKIRKRELVQARQVSMFFAKALTKKSLAHIGYKIGGKDHATVLHACKTINNLMDTEPKFRHQMEEIGVRVSKYTSAGEELYYNIENNMHYNVVQQIQNIRNEICWVVKDARRVEKNQVLEASDVANIRKVTMAFIECKAIPISRVYYAESRIIEDMYCETWHVHTLDRRIYTITFPRTQISEYLISE